MAAFCVIALARMAIRLGRGQQIQDPDRYLVANMHPPVSSQTMEATPDRPQISLRIELDPDQPPSGIGGQPVDDAAAGCRRAYDPLVDCLREQTATDAVVRT